ncbi:MAG: Molybdopterin-guanine dinucleotide biosynthesis adapter protein [Syntrophaceae bacterium PtaB.Bin038]|nr:MAG: Molybdopterin-guanine dinucleotide biosynthesis adapter protein [Syntrophaceae bacterium PtaB.Bin038]
MKPIPIVSIVGYSGSGKTTLVEKLIPELRKRGLRVATIKHNRHGFEVDREGKDSWRHRRAGAALTVLASPGKVAVMADTEGDPGLGELGERFVRDVDVILAEGFKKNPYPKIEVWRKAQGKEFLSRGDRALVAVAGDDPGGLAAPRFDLDDIEGIVDLIEKKVIRR